LLLAAGKGERLRPLTDDRPKSMVAIAGRPMVDYSLFWLRTQGITEVAINLHHLPDVLASHVGDGGRHGVRVRYSREVRLLGSAGALVPLLEFFRTERDFVVLYGDVLTNLDLAAVLDQHRHRGAEVTVVVTTAEDPTRCGVVEFDADGWIRSWIEKPRRDQVFSGWVNAGIYVCSGRVLEHLPRPCPVPYDFAADFVPVLLARGVRMAAVPTDARVFDIGAVERLYQAEVAIRSGLRLGEPARC
jgi:NDP-sugar pyrophosphorylase family protein